ncbi:beta-phosphoglucomutase [Weissella viridescens]|uniref:beta-phosphoglucomutase n=1 Tax=Weissella viridescens TaxID=1629 RepID=UPI001D067530|nr:beta-phosphoglucomutase [Weissella viridescens]MCB6839977.1 beta-phosphoglucomutase [Weissella viridescens]MCB6846789.1 beta-phosphoglucomutase [Weissella viridescens]WJI91514.1 beta-phosphoglucomutase [Weissella viridescens]
MEFTDIKGVAFDLDGVLADTAKFHTQAWRQLAERLGVKWTPQLQEDLKGIDRMGSLTLILKAGGLENQYTSDEQRDLAEQKNAAYKKLIATLTPVDILPGMQAFLDELKEHDYKLSVASASKNAPAILERLGLSDYFEGIVDPATLTAGKPDPEIFERAAEILHLDPTQVMGLEDSKAGIESIRGAHELAIGIGVPGDVTFDTTSDISLNQIKNHFDK